MNDHELRIYLGLSTYEFDALLAAAPDAVERYRDLARVCANLEQLPVTYNRPPKTDDEDPIHGELDALSEAAFARLDAAIEANEAFRRRRQDAPSGRRTPHSTGVSDYTFQRMIAPEEKGRKWARERGYRGDQPDVLEFE